jgi:hypothetical protein
MVMRCRLCHRPAGWFRRSCAICDRLWAVVTDNRGRGFSHIFDLLLATGASTEQVRAFLAADPNGRGSV